MTTLDQTPTSTPALDVTDRWLRWGALAFTVFVLAHNADHTRRGLDVLTADVLVAGSLAILVEIGIVVLIFLGHRFAPLAAVTTGFSLAGGYVLVHVLPERGWLSDPLFDGSGQGISQAAALVEIAGALALGVAGWLALRRRGGLASVDIPRPINELGAVLMHPVVAAMVVGNVVLYVAGVLG